MKMDELEFL